MAADPPSQMRRLLKEAGEGDKAASADLLPLVYDQLRAIARRSMAAERDDHTLQPTALVHEAFLRLVGDRDVGWDGRGHFYVAAAEAMRRILIEHARARGRQKRGGDRWRVPLSVLELATEGNPDGILSVDQAVRRLEQVDERLARVVQLRFYAGLSEKETARSLGLSDRTVRRDWVLARAWLARELGRDG